MSNAAYDVAIVGAGIVGAACADELARRGMRAVVVDREIVGSGATAAGFRRKYSMRKPCRPSSPTFAQELLEDFSSRKMVYSIRPAQPVFS
jgi:glycine/D-amino acid oxidase-like deaminating enzyme